MINYIVKYQNNFAHAYLFEHNFTAIMRKGINIEELLKSDLFYHTIDFDEWPQTHTIEKTTIMPYNGSLFNLRYKYSEVFEDLAKQEVKLDALK